MKNQHPSIPRILLIDYISFLTYFLSILIWVMFFVDKPNPDSKMLYVAIGVTSAAVLVFLWRIYYYNKIFDTGVETPAIIQRFLYGRIRGRVEYTFTYQGEEIRAHDSVIKYSGFRELAIGLQVTALVNPNNPRHAIIKDLYAKP